MRDFPPSPTAEGKELIGSVTIDTASVCIVDPAQAGRMEFVSLQEYRQGGDFGGGVITAAGYGDGVYPVYVEKMTDTGGHERVARVVIEFIRPDGTAADDGKGWDTF